MTRYKFSYTESLQKKQTSDRLKIPFDKFGLNALIHSNKTVTVKVCAVLGHPLYVQLFGKSVVLLSFVVYLENALSRKH